MGLARRRDGWTEREIETVRRHPELTARALAAMLPGRSPKAVSRMRDRIGRFPEQDAPRLCIRCDDRPVWAESARARKWGLCKGCFVEEEERRIAEEASAALVRQHRRRTRGGEHDESDPQKGAGGMTGGLESRP